MKRKLFTSLIAAVVFFLLQGSAFAHHGTSAYSTQVVTMKGTVTSFEFMNPHSEVRVDVTDASGHKVNWLCEAGSLNFLVRRGWSKDSLKPGDTITIMGNPGKSGSPNLRMTKVVLPDGKELNPLTGDQNVE
jgi:hypothetical protein